MCELTVDLAATLDTDLVPAGVHHLVVDTSLAWHTANSLSEVVAPARLVVNLRDVAITSRAEPLLGTDVGEAARLE